MPAVSETPVRKRCRDLGLALTDAQISNILKIKDFFRFYGRAMNLTGAHIDDQIDEALHAVALATRLDLRGRWLDVGSGGGFPGLVLAACLDMEFVFVEPRAKRASGLELALAKIGRGDVEVVRGRIERGQWRGIDGGELEGGFDVAGARAVFSVERWMEEGRAWVRGGGLLVLHVRSGEDVPEGARVRGRVDGGRWGVVGVEV